MRVFQRDRLRATSSTLLAAIVAVGPVTRAAVAMAQPDPEPASSDGSASVSGSFDARENDDGGADPPGPAPAPVPSVELAGGATGFIAPVGEAWTTWRYGRSEGRPPVDETTTRLRVSGSGRSFDGLLVGFSIGLLAPALRVGSFAPTASVAAAWARRDRVHLNSEIEWETSVADAGRSASAASSALALRVTSIQELSHTAERRGGVSIDVTHYRVHGTLDVTLPCTRSGAAFRRSCRPETIRGAF